MKKFLKKRLAIAVLPLMLLTAGCSIGEVSDEQGKAWAEENGYVKLEENSHVGVYEFEYAEIDGMRFNSCSLLDGFEENNYINFVKEECVNGSSIKYELTEDGYFKIIDGNEIETWKYVIDEKGVLLVSPLQTDIENGAVAGVYYNIYKFENGRFYEDGNIMGTPDSDNLFVTSVYAKKAS